MSRFTLRFTYRQTDPEYSPEWLARWVRRAKALHYLSVGTIAASGVLALTNAISVPLQWAMLSVGVLLHVPWVLIANHIDRRQEAVIAQLTEDRERWKGILDDG